MGIEERVAKALWDVVDYDRGWEWEDHPNEEMRVHYRERARKLLEQFIIYEKYEPRPTPITINVNNVSDVEVARFKDEQRRRTRIINWPNPGMY